MLVRDKLDRVSFGLFEVDIQAGELWKAGHRVKLPRQPFRVLAVLLARSGDIVSREELQREIWGENTNVDFDQAMAAAVNKIREALGDSAENPRFIQTLPKRGYKFLAPVTRIVNSAQQPSAGTPEKLIKQEDSTQSPVDNLSVEGDRSSAFIGVTRTGEASQQTLEAPPPLRINVHDHPNPRHRSESDGSHNNGRSQSGQPARLTRRKISYICLSTVALIAAVLGVRFFSVPPSGPIPLRVEQITRHARISLGPPNPESFLEMAMGGDRVLTSVMENGLPRLSYIDIDTGEVQGISLPDEIASNSLADVSKDGSRLLLRSQRSSESEQPLWVVPSIGGSGRRVPGVLAHDAAWMPDGAGILYATGNELAEVAPNEDSSTLLARLPGRAFWLRWSPDGELLRFTLFNPVTHAAALWEMTRGTHTAKPVQVPGASHLSSCCGVWLADGQTYVFQADENLWELRGRGRSATLLQLTNGPLRSLSPVATRNGNRIFFIGLEAPSGLQVFDSGGKAFRPAQAFLADANRVDYSRDGKWVAWTDIHEKLWRAHVDGSDKLRLTSDALEVFLAHWSPDGTRLALMARKPGGVWQIYLVDASGGKAEALLDETRNAADPGWSKDGVSLVFGREPDLMGKESGSRNLQIINLSTRKLEEIPNSDNLFSPRWSPDGHWIVALTLDQKNVVLYDVERRQWRRLASTSAADPVWGSDSKAIYVHAFLADREPILKIEVPDGSVQVVADLNNFHDQDAANYFFGGLTPRGEPLVQPRVGTGNLYSLDLKNP